MMMVKSYESVERNHIGGSGSGTTDVLWNI